MHYAHCANTRMEWTIYKLDSRSHVYYLCALCEVNVPPNGLICLDGFVFRFGRSELFLLLCFSALTAFEFWFFYCSHRHSEYHFIYDYGSRNAIDNDCVSWYIIHLVHTVHVRRVSSSWNSKASFNMKESATAADSINKNKNYRMQPKCMKRVTNRNIALAIHIHELVRLDMNVKKIIILYEWIFDGPAWRHTESD